MIGEAPPAPRVWWLRPWAIMVWLLLALPAIGLFALAVIGSWRPFYVPSESMTPALAKGDRFIAGMNGAEGLKRGDVVVFETSAGHIYVQRVAGLPGDRIEIMNGQVYLNERPVAQRQVGVDRIEPVMGAKEARRLSEQFPGEAKPHLIWDLMYTAQDDFPETVVKPGHVFVLGDNRDQSADSRVSADQMGVEQVPIARIRGKALFHGFFSSRRIGTRI
jgi:signal peptidase I